MSCMVFWFDLWKMSKICILIKVDHYFDLILKYETSRFQTSSSYTYSVKWWYEIKTYRSCPFPSWKLHPVCEIIWGLCILTFFVKYLSPSKEERLPRALKIHMIFISTVTKTYFSISWQALSQITNNIK